MSQRLTTLVLFLALLTQSLMGWQPRPARHSRVDCACHQPEPQNDCSCCRKKPALPRHDEQCPCPKGCNQCARTRDTDTRTLAVQRSAPRATAKTAAARPTVDLQVASTRSADVPNPQHFSPRAASPPAHLITLRTTVLVV